MDQLDKFCQLFVAKFLFYDFLEVGAFLDAVAVDIFVDPLINKFWVNVKGKDETGERLNTPWVSENDFGVGHIHTKLITEALLNIIGYFFELFVSFGNPSVGDLESW